MLETYVDGPYKTFEANVPADLIGKEGYVVEQVAASGKIQLLAAGIGIGVLHQRLENSDLWNVRLLGKGGTVKMVAGGAINTPARVKGAAGGKVTAAGSADRSIGIKTSPTTAAADGDVIEVIDVVELIP